MTTEQRLGLIEDKTRRLERKNRMLMGVLTMVTLALCAVVTTGGRQLGGDDDEIYLLKADMIIAKNIKVVSHNEFEKWGSRGTMKLSDFDRGISIYPHSIVLDSGIDNGPMTELHSHMLRFVNNRQVGLVSKSDGCNRV